MVPLLLSLHLLGAELRPPDLLGQASPVVATLPSPGLGALRPASSPTSPQSASTLTVMLADGAAGSLAFGATAAVIGGGGGWLLEHQLSRPTQTLGEALGLAFVVAIEAFVLIIAGVTAAYPATYLAEVWADQKLTGHAHQGGIAIGVALGEAAGVGLSLLLLNQLSNRSGQISTGEFVVTLAVPTVLAGVGGALGGPVGSWFAATSMSVGSSGGAPPPP